MIFIYPLGAPALYTYLLFFKYGRKLRLLAAIETERTMIAKGAAANDEYARWNLKTGVESKAGSARRDEVKPQLASSRLPTLASAHLPALPLTPSRLQVKPRLEELAKEKAAIKATLPHFIQTLAGNGYALRVFYFEIIECLRKLSIVCVPVFFPPGSSSQLLFGLIVCFLTYGMYSALRPYGEAVDNTFANLGQLLIFFAILSSIALTTYGVRS